jgi:hypothetical protein
MGTGAVLAGERTRPLLPPTAAEEAANDDLIPPAVEGAWSALVAGRLAATRDAVALSALAFDAPAVYVGGESKPSAWRHGDADDDAALAVSLGTAPDPYEFTFAAAVHAAEADRDAAEDRVSADISEEAAAAMLLADALPTDSSLLVYPPTSSIAALTATAAAPTATAAVPPATGAAPTAKATHDASMLTYETVRLGYPSIRTHGAPADGAPPWSDGYAFRYSCARRALLEKETTSNPNWAAAAALQLFSTQALPAEELVEVNATAAAALREAAARRARSASVAAAGAPSSAAGET